jgi:hypothetical protein
MTDGTRSQFLDLPEDINPPKPGYFHDVYHMVHAYLQLLSHVPESAVPDKGLIKLWSYRIGVLDFDTNLLEQTYGELVAGNRLQQSKLQRFGQSCITYNLQMLYQLLANTLVRDITRNFGDGACLSGETIAALDQFCRFQGRRDGDRNLESLVNTTRYNAIYPRGGAASTQVILRLIEIFDRIIMTDAYDSGVEQTSRTRMQQLLRVIFNIGCRYYHVNMLRLNDELVARRYDRTLRIADFTLAAVPFDPMMTLGCADDTSQITRWGVEYLQTVDTVLSAFGGVRMRYAPAFYTEITGNKGSANV